MPSSDSEDDQEVRVARSGVHSFSPAALRRRRELKGLTLSELTSLSGISQSSIGTWEAGTAVPTPGNLAAVARALGAEVADLAPVRATQLRMADLRHQAGLSQEDVAPMIGVSRGTVANIEAGARRPDPEVLTALAAAYGAPEDTVAEVWERTHAARMVRLRTR